MLSAHRCVALLLPLCAHALLSGAELAVTAPSGYAQDAPLTIACGRPLPTRFAVPAQTWDHGDDSFTNGVPDLWYVGKPDGTFLRDDRNGIWSQMTYKPGHETILDRQPSHQRHRRIGMNYRWNQAKGDFGWPRGAGGAVPPLTTDAVYVRWWVRTTLPFFGHHLRNLMASRSGEFQSGVPGVTIGEPLRIDYIDRYGRPKTTYGDLSYVLDDGTIEFMQAPHETWLSTSDRTNGSCVLTGMRSGATATLATTGDHPAGSTKMARIWDNDAGTPPCTRNSFQHDHLYCNAVPATWKNVDWYDTTGSWHLMEIEARWIRADHRYIARLVHNGAEVYRIDGIDTQGQHPTQNIVAALIGFDPGTTPFANTCWISEPYHDCEFSRVVIADAPAWSEARFNEIQRITAWDPATGAISVAQNWGAFEPTTTAWLYVLDDQGAPLSTTGVPVGGATVPSDPPPAGGGSKAQDDGGSGGGCGAGTAIAALGGLALALFHLRRRA